MLVPSVTARSRWPAAARATATHCQRRQTAGGAMADAHKAGKAALRKVRKAAERLASACDKGGFEFELGLHNPRSGTSHLFASPGLCSLIGGSTPLLDGAVLAGVYALEEAKQRKLCQLIAAGTVQLTPATLNENLPLPMVPALCSTTLCMTGAACCPSRASTARQTCGGTCPGGQMVCPTRRRA